MTPSERIGFITQSVRVPIATGSLIILVIAMYDEEDNPLINRALINKLYMDAAEMESEGYIKYTREQNVSSDINANFGPAVIIEGNETHTRTAVVTLDISKFFAKRMVPEGVSQNVNISITQAVVYGLVR